MIQQFNAIGAYIEAVLLGLVIGVIVGFCVHVANERMQPQPMRVLSSYEAMQRGWAIEFEE